MFSHEPALRPGFVRCYPIGTSGVWVSTSELLGSSSGGGVGSSGSGVTVGSGGRMGVGLGVGSSVGPGGGLGSSVGTGVGESSGFMVGSAEGDADGDTEGEAEGDALGEAEGETVGPAIWSEPPLQVPGALPLAYQPTAVSKQPGPASLPLLRQKVIWVTFSLMTHSLPDQS